MAYEIRERRPGCHVEIIPEVVGCMGRSTNKLRKQIARILETAGKKMTRTWREMHKTLLAESESTIRKMLPNIITAVLDEDQWLANLSGLPTHNWPYNKG